MESEYYRMNGSKFSERYFCYPFFSNIQKPELENGDKILMPASASERLIAQEVDYPMMFSVENAEDSSCTSHCGVLEFTAEEGFIYMPQWMMDNLKLKQGDIVILKNDFLPQGTCVKLQPHTTDFVNLSNPKAVLETTLRKYTCLTSGDTITITHNEKEFRIDVLETKPTSAISIVNTDCEVDFAAPLDFKEHEKKAIVQPAAAMKSEVGESKEKPKFVPFTGLARQLDGTAVLPDDLVNNLQKIHSTDETSSRTCACEKPPGKMVFGSDVIAAKPLKKSMDVSKNEGKNFCHLRERVTNYGVDLLSISDMKCLRACRIGNLVY